MFVHLDFAEDFENTLGLESPPMLLVQSVSRLGTFSVEHRWLTAIENVDGRNRAIFSAMTWTTMM